MGKEIEIASLELISLNNKVKKGDYSAVKSTLQTNPEFVNYYLSTTYESPLANALSRNPIDFAMLDLLVKNKVEFDYPINRQVELPLEWACKNQDVKLVNFLIKHGAVASERAPHFLLSRGKHIKFLNTEQLFIVCRIIESLGGLEAVSKKINANGETFGLKANQSQLINLSGGVLKYNYMDLLNAAYPLRNIRPLPGPDTQEQYKELQRKILMIHEEYSQKQEQDRTIFLDSIKLHFMTKNNSSSKEVVSVEPSNAYS